MQALVEALIPFGALPLVFGFWQLWRELSPRNWVRATGTVTASKIDACPNNRGGVDYVPTIEYEYQYNGRSFNSSRRRMGNYTSGGDSAAQAICARYPVCGSVTVLVHPKRPAQSVLEFGSTPLSWVFIVLGLFIEASCLLPLLAK
jgi:hypothetical protein